MAGRDDVHHGLALQPQCQPPILYKINDHLEVTATFHLDQAWTGGAIYVWANGTGDSDSDTCAFSIAPKLATVSGTTVTVTNAVAVSSFPYVDDYSAASLNWYASANGSNSAVSLGSTTNEIYVTYQAPQVSAADGSDPALTDYRTLFSVGCKAARFDGDPNAVIQDVWGNAFATRSVQTAENTPLSYYKSYYASADNTTSLLVSGDGKCGAGRTSWRTPSRRGDYPGGQPCRNYRFGARRGPPQGARRCCS